MNIKKTLTLAFTISLSVIVYGQGNLLTKKELESVKKYTSLEEALKEPEKVYVLSLGEDIELRYLPNDIGRLVNLQIFSVGGNHLTRLPKSIGNLKNLQILSAGGNDLEKIPKTMKKLKNLQEVYLWGNSFSLQTKKKIKRQLGNNVSILF